MSDLTIQNRESEQEVMPSFDFLLERETERNTLLAEHRAWLKEIKRERPLPKTHYRVAVYIRYFNQTRYEDYLSAHKKQFLDTLALCPNWKFVGFYVDEGSTAPNMENAPEWSRLLQDCYEEKVNLIITQKASNISKKLSELSFCTRMRIPYGVKELDFPSRDAAIAWICANQLGRRNISEETRKYLIGKQYEAEKKVQRNRNGYNQYRPNPNITVGRGRPIDEESGRRTAARLGREYHVSGATVQKYAKYSAALDAIAQNAPELVPHILSGAYKISFENIVALSEMEPEELKALSKKIGKNPYAFARYSESRRCLYSDASAKPGTAAAEQPAIKTMPAYDPDAEVAGLTLTIPSWMSSIDRTKSMAHLEAISPAARQNLLAALTELEGKIQEMLNAIEGES